MKMLNEPSAPPHVGEVVAIEGENARLRFERGKMCSRCGACLAIGAKEMEMSLPNTLDAAVGDNVSVQLQGKQMAGASLIAYGIPLLLLLLGIWLGSSHSDLAAVLCGLGGCAISFIVLRLIDRRLKRRNALQPKMCAILPREALEDAEK